MPVPSAPSPPYEDIVRKGQQFHPIILKSNGKPGKQSEAHILLRRFRLHADAILRFIADPAVPFSNSVAERVVRMPKVKQRISGCFLDSLRKQGNDMLNVLRKAFYGP